MTFKPYHVIDDDRDPEEILDFIHLQFNAGKGPDTTKGLRFDKLISFEISDFIWIARELSRLPSLVSISARDYVRGNYPVGKVPLIIRHDLDGDLETAIEMAKIEVDNGQIGTFYVLPADLYYSDYYLVKTPGPRPYLADTVRRYRRMAPYYREIQDIGHEVGIHYFPYGVYREKLMDGAQSIIDEVRWLRSHGIDIHGGVGHSSRAAQGADMPEIFTEFRNPNVNCEASPIELALSGNVDFDGLKMPRHLLSLKDIPLEYVLEFSRSSRGYWAIRENGAILHSPAIDEPSRRTDYMAPSGMVQHIRQRLDAGELYLVTIMVHPVHVRSRVSPRRLEEAAVRSGGSAPLHRIGNSNAKLRQPGSLHVVDYTAQNGAIMEVASVVNRHGFLDYEPYPEDELCRKQIAMVGGKLLDSPHLQISQKLQGWLRKLFWQEDRLKLSTRCYAAEDLDAEILRHILSIQQNERDPGVWLIFWDEHAEANGGEFTEFVRTLQAKKNMLICIVDNRSTVIYSKAKNLFESVIYMSDLVEQMPKDDNELIDDSQCMLVIGRTIKDMLSERVPEFFGTSIFYRKEVNNRMRRNFIRKEMALTREAARKLEDFRLQELPDSLLTLPPRESAVHCGIALAKFRMIFEAIDTEGNTGLAQEISRMLQPNIYSGNFHTVLGHASRMQNLATSYGLDLGCSFGVKTVLLRHFGARRIVGCDVIADLIRGANIWLPQTPFNDMRFYTNSVAGLPFDAKQFDWVTCMGLYANLNPNATVPLFEECARVLRAGGLLLFHDGANPHHLVSAERIRKFHRQQEIGAGTLASPDGEMFRQRMTIIAERFPELPNEEIKMLARETCYLLREEIALAVEGYRATGTGPSSPFADGDLSRAPIWPLAGNASMRPTDPFQIKRELESVGFAVKFRRPVLGADIDEAELEHYFTTAPGVFITAQKRA